MNKESQQILNNINSQFLLAKKSGRRLKKGEEDIAKDAKDVETQIKQLQDDMEDALLHDRESNKNKKPAFKRLLLLGRIEGTLRKTNLWQEEFLHKDGC